MEIIYIESLVKKYPKGVEALKGIDLSINKGELFTLLGPNGAGKTTLLRIAATQLLPTSGKTLVFGEDVLKNPQKIRERIAVVPQDVMTYGYYTPFDYAYYLPLLRGVTHQKARVLAEKALKTVELWELRNRTCASLSGGEKRRAIIASVLASDVDLLMLDEPTSGLDAVSRRKVWAALRELVKEGKTIILTTHNMEEAEIASDRLAIIDKGLKVAQGALDEVKGLVEEKYRVMVRGILPNREGTKVGDRSIFYTKSEEEALKILHEALSKGLKSEISLVNLEDVFIKLIGGLENENN